MSLGLFKALSQTANYFWNWRTADAENATRHGQKYMWLILFGGFGSLWVLYQHDIAAASDFALFSAGIVLVESLQFGTLVRMSMVVDPMVGGILGTIGLGSLAKFFRDIGGASAAIRYFFSIR
ncbi:hypothetical protein [Natronoglomus mannanivorans]|uniref:Uncharacterized protein n=1 Tax=Natronoglomus mannanivorans TaxID=2979990 RepID=A0AAP3E487_9EURY|nr:hypothetical protein [Halobacteria archaeon AArc-xg1-1]